MIMQPDQDLIHRMREIRRALHRFPELAYQEKQTAAFIAKELSCLGVSHRTGIGGTGILAELGGNGGGDAGPQRCLALRADMDALPLGEEFYLHKSRHDACLRL